MIDLGKEQRRIDRLVEDRCVWRARNALEGPSVAPPVTKMSRLARSGRDRVKLVEERLSPAACHHQIAKNDIEGRVSNLGQRFLAACGDIDFERARQHAAERIPDRTLVIDDETRLRMPILVIDCGRVAIFSESVSTSSTTMVVPSRRYSQSEYSPERAARPSEPRARARFPCRTLWW